jgi:hypothetical protein
MDVDARQESTNTYHSSRPEFGLHQAGNGHLYALCHVMHNQSLFDDNTFVTTGTFCRNFTKPHRHDVLANVSQPAMGMDE